MTFSRMDSGSFPNNEWLSFYSTFYLVRNVSVDGSTWLNGEKNWHDKKSENSIFPPPFPGCVTQKKVFTFCTQWFLLLTGGNGRRKKCRLYGSRSIVMTNIKLAIHTLWTWSLYFVSKGCTLALQGKALFFYVDHDTVRECLNGDQSIKDR